MAKLVSLSLPIHHGCCTTASMSDTFAFIGRSLPSGSQSRRNAEQSKRLHRCRKESQVHSHDGRIRAASTWINQRTGRHDNWASFIPAEKRTFPNLDLSLSLLRLNPIGEFLVIGCHTITTITPGNCSKGDTILHNPKYAMFRQ